MISNFVKYLVRQGSDSDRKQVILDAGELGFANDVGYNRLFVGDGVTHGGNPVATKLFIVPSWASTTNLGYVQQYDMVYIVTDSRLYSLTGTTSTLSGNYIRIASNS